MKNLKNILVGCLVLWQGISFCAEAQEARVLERIPQIETLVCYNKGLREDVQPLLVNGVLQLVSSGRFHKTENGRIEHVPLTDLRNTFYLFEESGVREFECDVSVLQRILFDYGVGGVTDPNPDGPAVYGDDYDRLIAILCPKTEKKLKAQKQVAVVEVDPRQAMLKSLPDEVTLKCTDGMIEDIPVPLLVNNFGYFDAYLRNWGTGRFAHTGKEIVVDGTVQDMNFLLAYVLDLYRLWNPASWDFGSGSGLDKIPPVFSLEPVSYLSLLKLANQLCLEKEKMDNFLERYDGDIQQELYSKPAYEKFLKDGDSENLLAAIAMNRHAAPSLETIDLIQEVPHDSMIGISPDGHYGVIRFDGGYQVVSRNAEGPKILFNIPLRGGSENVVQFSPDSKLVWIAKTNKEGQLWDIESKERLMRSDRGFYEVRFSPDSKWVIIENTSGLDELWNTAMRVEQRFEASIVYRNNVGVGAVFSADSSRLSFPINGGVKVCNLVSGEDTEISTSWEPRYVHFSLDGKRVGCESGRAGFQLYDVSGNECVLELHDVFDFAFTANSSVLVLEKQDRSVVFYDLITKKETAICSGQYLGRVSPNGEAFIFYNDNLRSLITLGMNGPVFLRGSGYGDFAFNAASNLMAGLSEKNKIAVYEVATGAQLLNISLEGMPGDGEGAIQDIAFGSGGTFLIVKYYDVSRLGMQSFVINLPLEKTVLHNSSEERYFYHALKSRVQEAGHKLDRLSLPLELEAMFDRLPQVLRSEILTSEGLVERFIAKRTEDLYRKMKDYSENTCRELQVYNPL